MPLPPGPAQPSFEAMLDAEQRRGLGLCEEESIRVLHATPRVLMLEKTRSDAIPLPFDRDLVLSADVRAFSLADLLQLVHSSAKSGFLYFEHGDCVKTVYLHAGEVVFATSNQRVDRLGEVLLRSGMITVEQHLQADHDFRPPAPFGRFLVELGFLTPRQLWDGVKHQVEEMVRSLFAFGAGHVLFWEGEVRPDNVVRLSLPTERLIEEGLSQRDELLEFLAQLEDPRLRIRLEDGRKALEAEIETYDLIETDATWPETAGSGSLYSREFFEAAARRLDAGGVMCTWAPTPRTARTFRSVFPYVVQDESGGILIGSRDPIAFEPDIWIARAESGEAYLGPARSRDVAGALAGFQPTAGTPAEGTLNRDLFPRDELAVPQD